MSLLAAGAAMAQELPPLPSGQAITLHEVLIDDSPGETWLRFRFLAPAIARAGGSVDFKQAAADMDLLCQSFALPYLSQHGLDPARIVVSMADRVVPFGESDPEATQFFEAFRQEGARCILEEY